MGSPLFLIPNWAGGTAAYQQLPVLSTTNEPEGSRSNGSKPGRRRAVIEVTLEGDFLADHPVSGGKPGTIQQRSFFPLDN